MKVVKKVQCAAIHEVGIWKGKRCTEKYNLIKCSQAITNGCDNYYCLIFHWPEHWKVHANIKTD